MRLLWYSIVAVIVPIFLFSALVCAFALANIYMVTVGSVSPGEPVYVDELAPPLINSITLFLVTLAVCIASAVVRRFALGKLAG